MVSCPGAQKLGSSVRHLTQSWEAFHSHEPFFMLCLEIWNFLKTKVIQSQVLLFQEGIGTSEILFQFSFPFSTCSTDPMSKY